MFSRANGSAASLDAVENAISQGCRTARKNRASGMRASSTTPPMANTTNTISAAYRVPTSLLKLNSTPTPFLPMVTAMAAPTPSGARYITYPVYLNITSASDSQNCVTGFARAPSAAQPMPNRMLNTTICSTSPRAIESIMLVGKVCSRISAIVNFACGRFVTATLLMVNPAPGRVRFTAAKPTNSAIVVNTSK